MMKTELCERLGLEVPIIQAPMAGTSTPELVAAVCNAGGLGSLGCAALAPDDLREKTAAIRSKTNRGFNLNFFAHEPPRPDAQKAKAMADLLAPYHAELGLGAVPEPQPPVHPFDRDRLDALLDDPPPVVSFHFGLPAPELLRPLQEKGAFVLSSATTVAEARWLAGNGVDAIIAQGAEAGGHRGTFLNQDYAAALIGTMALVPQIVDAVDLPVIAAGGIADGRGLAAALMLGAQAVQMGTAFLSTEEANVSQVHRDALDQADGGETTVTKVFSGRPGRMVRNRYIEEMRPHEDSLPDFPLAYGMSAVLRAEAAKRGIGDMMLLWAGQAAGLNRALSAAGLVESIAAEAEALLSGKAG